LATKGNASNGCTISKNYLINLTYVCTRRIADERNTSTESFQC